MSGSVDIFLTFLRLGCTSFGGPAAHVGYFRRDLVERRRWITEATLSEFLGLTQLLPGPSSSQTGFLIGIARGGLAGGFLAWLGFTLPSAALMILFAAGVKHAHGGFLEGALRGLEIAAVAVVANAVVNMLRTLCPYWSQRWLACGAAALLYFYRGGVAEIAVLLAGALLGWLVIRQSVRLAPETNPLPVSRSAAAVCLVLFAGTFVGLQLAAGSPQAVSARLLNAFYRTGSLVFGGGHVVLPLLNQAVVQPGWVSSSDFLAGYGAAQTLPGPLFTLAAYLGYTARTPLHGICGALLCLLCIFLPGLLLAAAAAPFWTWLRRHQAVQFALGGVNAVVVGFLVAALLHATLSGAIRGPVDAVLAMAAFLVLLRTTISPVFIVLAVAILSGIYTLLLLPA